MSSRFIVTGGAGFIGARLATDLLSEGHQVLVYDDLRQGKREFLPQSDRLTFERGDLGEADRLAGIVAGFKPDVVYHLAAIHYIPYCNEHPMETLRVNVEGTESVLRACARTRPGRLVFASSAAVYPVADHAVSEAEPSGPIDIYGITKVMGEMLIGRYHRDTGVPCVMARLFNVYGPNDTNPHLVPELVAQAKAGARVELGNMDPKRDYIHVGDVSSALRSLREPPVACEAFNVGTGTEYSVTELVDVLSSLLGKPFEVVSVPARRRAVERMHLLSDAGKLRRTTGWQPRQDLRSGLRELLQ